MKYHKLVENAVKPQGFWGKMMIKSKFYKQNGVEFTGLSAVICKKKDLEGKILQGLFCEKIYAISAKVGLHRNKSVS